MKSTNSAYSHDVLMLQYFCMKLCSFGALFSTVDVDFCFFACIKIFETAKFVYCVASCQKNCIVLQGLNRALNGRRCIFTYSYFARPISFEISFLRLVSEKIIQVEHKYMNIHTRFN